MLQVQSNKKQILWFAKVRVKKKLTRVSLMYSMGSSVHPAGLGRAHPLGHRSLMDASFTETQRMEEEKYRGNDGNLYNVVDFGEENKGR